MLSALPAHDWQLDVSVAIVKTILDKPRIGDLKPEYQFDYSKARPNRFAERATEDVTTVVLDSDVAQLFHSAEAVNEALRLVIRIMRENQSALAGVSG